jgi:diguanylate cyclase (GGDEF)-like protein/PAS domain S-box-containing protein
MLIADQDGYYVGANPAAGDLLELPWQALIGRRMTDFLTPDTDFEASWQSFLARGQARGELPLVMQNGSVKTVEFAAKAHVYPNRHLSILRDITDRKRVEAERDALAQQLQQQVAQNAEQRRQSEATLRSQQQHIDSILNSLQCVVWSVNPITLETTYANAAAEVLYGYPVAAFLADANLWLNCVYAEDRPLILQDVTLLLKGNKTDRTYRIVRADGEMRWVRGQARLVRDGAGNPLRIDGTTTDISDWAQLEADRRRAELALKDTQATQQAILEAIPDLLMRINSDGYILDLISGGEVTLYGAIPGGRTQSVYVNFPQDLADQRMHYVRLALDTSSQQRYEHTLEIDGQLCYEESRVVPINDTEVLVIVRDITERKQAEATQAELTQKLQLINAKLNRLATIDGLTQIANRRSFDQALDLEWQRARRQQQPLSLIFCDIDYFKPYNDNYGHLAGDDCLRQVAQVLITLVRRPGDLAARYGGEEFVLLLPNTTLPGAIQMVEQVQAAIAQRHLPHAYSPVSPIVTLSFGLVCHCPGVQEPSPRELIHQADLALYEAKAQGRDRYVVGAISP